jgi:hypothetical protein
VDEVAQPVELALQLQAVSGPESSALLMPLRIAVEQLAVQRQPEQLLLPP